MAQQEQPRGDVLMEWTFPEFTRHDRSRSWYLGFVATIIILIAFLVWQKNYTFVAFIVLAAFIITIRLRRIPPQVHFAIREEGVEVGSQFHPWREFKEFWIIYRPPEVKKLYLHFKGLRPAHDISLEDQNPLRVRQYLSENLVENTELEEEPLGDQLTRYFKI